MGAKPEGHRGNIAQRFMAAKLLAIASILISVASFVNFAAMVAPYWFKVKSTSLNTQLTEQDRVLTHYMGLFGYMKTSMHTPYESTGWMQLNLVQKATNAMLVPDMLKVAQIFWLLGTMSSIVCSVGLILVSCSQYFHLVAEIALGGATTLSAVSLVMSVILSIASVGASCDTQNNWCTNMWRTSSVSLESVTWGFFIAVIGAVMTLVCAVLVWMQFCRTWRAVEYIRTTPYHPLDDEKEYRQYDYRKTVRPPIDYRPAPPMVTLPQMHHSEHGFAGVIISSDQRGRPPAYAPEYRDPNLGSPGYKEYSGSQEVSF